MMSPDPRASQTWKCQHCGEVLSAKTHRPAHEETLTCTASRNRAEAKKRGLEYSDSFVAAAIAEKLGIDSERVFDTYRKPRWGRGRRAERSYFPAWFVELTSGLDRHVTNFEEQTDQDAAIARLVEVLRPAVHDLEERAKLHTVATLGGVEAVLALVNGGAS
jgi:hypothetical protein